MYLGNIPRPQQGIFPYLQICALKKRLVKLFCFFLGRLLRLGNNAAFAYGKAEVPRL
jgi:hypothetical protein